MAVMSANNSSTEQAPGAPADGQALEAHPPLGEGGACVAAPGGLAGILPAPPRPSSSGARKGVSVAPPRPAAGRPAAEALSAAPVSPPQPTVPSSQPAATEQSAAPLAVAVTPASPRPAQRPPADAAGTANAGDGAPRPGEPSPRPAPANLGPSIMLAAPRAPKLPPDNHAAPAEAERSVATGAAASLAAHAEADWVVLGEAPPAGAETPPGDGRWRSPPMERGRIDPTEPDDPEEDDLEPRQRPKRSHVGLTVGVSLAFMVLLAIQITVHYLRHDREVTITSLSTPLRNLPHRLGAWTGHDTPLDERVWTVMGADEVVNRQYQEDAGGTLGVQISAFKERDSLPHEPVLCYTNAGWQKVEEKEIRLKIEAQGTRLARILTFEQERHRIHVMYWYQFADVSVLDNDSLRTARWKLYGEKTWPPIVKVMVQSTTVDVARAEPELRTFGEQVLAWTKDLK